tara:strand:+ start:1723 stop:2217 length:495 start_codon:yes stop_codon:yes gene_type:complete
MYDEYKKFRSNKLYEYEGDHYTLKALSIKCEIGYSSLRARVRRHPNAPIADLLYKPGTKYRTGTSMYAYRGMRKSCAEWAKYCGVDTITMYNRFKHRTPAQAIENRTRTTLRSNWGNPPPDYDKWVELKQRILAYQDRGWSDEEILYKICHGDSQLRRNLAEIQ